MSRFAFASSQREHLQCCGYTLLATGAATRFGTIGVVARRRGTLVFSDVEGHYAYSSCNAPDCSQEDYRRSVRRQAAAWLAAHPGECVADEMRSDAIHVVIDRGGGLFLLEHDEAAA